jgi:hypothetical protein
VNQPRVKKNTLGSRRFAGINVRGDADVASALHRVLTIGRVSGLFLCSLHIKFLKRLLLKKAPRMA